VGLGVIGRGHEKGMTRAGRSRKSGRTSTASGRTSTAAAGQNLDCGGRFEAVSLA
jgi:hypothetical protein